MREYNHLTVDLNAIYHNLTTINAALGFSQRLMPMVKAEAYGTDALTLITFFKKCGIDIFGLSHLSEALELRMQGIDSALFVIGISPFDAPYVAQYDIEVAVSDLEVALALSREATKLQKSLKVHLDINTGMYRFGCQPEEALKLALEIKKLPGLILEGIMTHFVAAEVSHHDPFSIQQISLFKEVWESFKQERIDFKWVHAANSAGICRFNLPFCNMARVGLALFGIYTSEDEKRSLNLMPALKLETSIMKINRCKKNESVGYGRSYIAKRDEEKIAVLPIGYHDGIHLEYSGKGYMLIHGKEAPILGRVCMDFMMVDVTHIPEAKVGDKVLVFGRDEANFSLTPEVFAGFVKTNVRELLACLGPRIKRQFIPFQAPTPKFAFDVTTLSATSM